MAIKDDLIKDKDELINGELLSDVLNRMKAAIEKERIENNSWKKGLGEYLNCPHCYIEIRDPEEYVYTDHEVFIISCSSCKKRFEVKSEVDVTYYTRKID